MNPKKNDDIPYGLIFPHPKRGLDLHPIHCPGCGNDMSASSIGHVLVWKAKDNREFFAQIGKGSDAAEFLGYDLDDCVSREPEEGESVPSLDYCEDCELQWVLFSALDKSSVEH